MEIKNLKKAGQRILKAIKNQEKIILYGDADLDGVSSVIILEETIKSLANTIYNRQRVKNRRARSHISDERTDYIQRGGLLFVYFPDRGKEGYGLNFPALKLLKKDKPALLVTLDCGISNYEEAKLAKKLDFELIIIDHHEVLNNKLPQASIIVDPKQKGDRSFFKEFATVGIAFKLVKIIFHNNIPDDLQIKFLQMVALGTIADMMKREKDNKIFVEEGFKYLKNSPIIAIKSFLKSSYIKNINEFSQKITQIISLLNVRDVKNNLPISFRLLTASSLENAEDIVEKLLCKNTIRKEKIKKIVREIETNRFNSEEPIILTGKSSWDLLLLGTAASIISRKYNKPTFLFKKDKDRIQGTSRTSKGFNLVRAMEKCAYYLKTYGGHPKAAGFSLKNKNLDKFKQCLIKYSKNLCPVRNRKGFRGLKTKYCFEREN